MTISAEAIAEWAVALGLPCPTGQSAPTGNYPLGYTIDEIHAVYSTGQPPIRTTSVGLVSATRLWGCATNGCPERPGIAVESAPTCYTCARPMVERLGGLSTDGLEWEPVQSTWCCPATTCADRAPIRAATAPRCYVCGTMTRPAISSITETLDAMKSKLASTSAMPVMWTCTEGTCVGRAPVRSTTRPRCYTCARPMLARWVADAEMLARWVADADE